VLWISFVLRLTKNNSLNVVNLSEALTMTNDEYVLICQTTMAYLSSLGHQSRTACAVCAIAILVPQAEKRHCIHVCTSPSYKWCLHSPYSLSSCYYTLRSYV